MLSSKKLSASSLVLIFMLITVFPQVAEARFKFKPRQVNWSEIRDKVCSWGVCWGVVEQAIDVYKESSESSSSQQQSYECLSQGKGCYTIRTGGSWEYSHTIYRTRKVRVPN
jgi:hypothetical protein